MGEIYREREQMRYPVDVFTGKVRDYTGSRPSAIAKVQIDGELMLTALETSVSGAGGAICRARVW